MEFSLPKNRMALIAGPTDAEVEAALDASSAALSEYYAASAEFRVCHNVASNLEAAAAAVDKVGVSREFLSVFNCGGKLLDAIGYGMSESIALEAEAADEAKAEANKEEVKEKIEEKKRGMISTIIEALKRLGRAIIDLIRKFFVSNEKIQKSLEAGLPGIDSMDEAAFLDTKTTALPADTVLNTLVPGLDALNNFLTGCSAAVATDVAKLLTEPSANVTAFNGKDGTDKIAAIGVTINDGKVSTDASKLEKKTDTYKALGYSKSKLKDIVIKAIAGLKSGRAKSKDVMKKTEEAYKKAIEATDTEAAGKARTALSQLNSMIAYQAKLTTMLGQVADEALRRAKGGKKAAPAKEDEKKPEEDKEPEAKKEEEPAK